MNRAILVIILEICILGILSAQDYYFSQFYSSPLTLNPAMTGLFNGDYRVVTNYRNQNEALTPFNTYSASFDTKILQKILEQDVFSVGLVLVQDELLNKSVSNTVLMFSTAYHDRIGENDYLAAGLQGGLYQTYVNMYAFTYPQQWDPITGEASLPITEQFQNTNIDLFDMNIGLIWYHYMGKSSSIFLGGAIFHVAQPETKYLNTNGYLSRRYVFHGGAHAALNDKISLVPIFVVEYQNKANQVIIGTTVEYRSNNNAFKFGGWYKCSGMYTFYLGMEFKGVELGASYDFVSSSDYLGNNIGGVEISLIFTSFYKKSAKLKSNPGNRF